MSLPWARVVTRKMLMRMEPLHGTEPKSCNTLRDYAPLHAWANLEMFTGTLETAEVLYVDALEYRPQNQSLLRARLAHVRKLLKKK